MLMPLTLAGVLLPALSVAVPAATLAPLAVRTTGSGQVAMPARASEHVKVTVTGPLYQPLAVWVPLVIAPVMAGAVLSSLTMTESVPTLPAVSVAVPVIAWPAVSVETVTGAVRVPVATPEPLSSSLATNVTVTLVLFQSSAFGWGDRLWLTAGAMLSHLSPTLLAGSTLPALSTA